MKKVVKIFIISICTFLAICQINSHVYSYTIDEVKEAIEFKTVEEAGEPSEYDILIDSEDLKSDIQFPYIKNSVESVLYVEDGLLDIDFFKVNSNNTNSTWLTISQTIRNVFHIFMYIGAALLLTILIYFAVVTVISSVFQNDVLPLNNFFSRRNNSNYEGRLREKIFIEQWITLVLLLPSLVLIINLLISLSSAIVDLTDVNDWADEKYNYVIYVKNSKGDTNPNKNYYFKTNIEGMLMFKTQYKWTKAPLKNIINIISGLFITAFKYFVKGLFIVRMFVIAGLTIISPILLIINALYRISGSRGILKKALILYLYMIFIKPAIALIFYLLIGINPTLVSAFSLYSLVIVIATVIIFIFSAWLLIRALKNKTSV